MSNKDIISTRKAISGSHFQSKLLVVLDVLGLHHKLNQVLFLNVDGEDLTNLVDTDHAVGGHVADGSKDQLVGDTLAVDECSFEVSYMKR